MRPLRIGVNRWQIHAIAVRHTANRVSTLILTPMDSNPRSPFLNSHPLTCPRHPSRPFTTVVVLLIGRRAARDFAADDPVFVGVTRHRPLRVGIERLLVAPLLDQKDELVVVFRQHQVELQAAVITARALRMPAHQVDELATVLRLRFELDDDHDLASGRTSTGKTRRWRTSIELKSTWEARLPGETGCRTASRAGGTGPPMA